MLENFLEAGLSAAGLSVVFTGLMPTPAIAYLTRIFSVEAGIVISASHNPYYDNGIKLFSIHGTKLSDDIEKEIEIEINKPLTCVESYELGRASCIIDAAGIYIEYCKSTFPSNQSLSGLKIVLDCANGATYHIAPKILSDLGAEVITIGCEPDGLNINHGCGATEVMLLQKHVVEEKADIGLAFDGDGDRVIMVDHYGNIVTGDQILYIIAYDAFQNGQLHGGVVGTLMSNMGLELALQQLDIPFIRTKVGDRYIIEKLQEQGWHIGAENSGHIILLDKTTTGDGIIASLQVLSIMIHNNISLYDLYYKIKLMPQVLLNVHFSGNNNPLATEHIQNIVNKVERELYGIGRVLLRKSGTEPLIRIMVEGKNKKQVIKMANWITEVIKEIK
ncbi:MAG: phosphoglucosamine mutase [Arsenophonus endosymbiont of Ceratovacuna japonica]